MNREPGVAPPLRDRDLAAWILSHRRQIEQELHAQGGVALPGAGEPEAEALRRFRSLVASALLRGEARPPSLDGLRVDEDRSTRVVQAWCDAATRLAGARGEALSARLGPLAADFCTALRGTQPARRIGGVARTGRRAVRAAIDRVSDVFLAVDAHSDRIVDANPAAGALLGLSRDDLLACRVASFLDDEARRAWQDRLDAVSEGGEPARFRWTVRTRDGACLDLDARVTRYVTRQRSLALVMARPLASAAELGG